MPSFVRFSMSVCPSFLFSALPGLFLFSVPLFCAVAHAHFGRNAFSFAYRDRIPGNLLAARAFPFFAAVIGRYILSALPFHSHFAFRFSRNCEFFACFYSKMMKISLPFFRALTRKIKPCIIYLSSYACDIFARFPEAFAFFLCDGRPFGKRADGRCLIYFTIQY